MTRRKVIPVSGEVKAHEREVQHKDHSKQGSGTINWEAVAKARAKRIRALYRELRRDPLTGVGNRYLLDKLMERRTQLKTGYLVAVVDLDNFKTINDTLGHAVGDEVLKAAAKALRRCCRAMDRVIRQGGDEFTIVMRKICPEDTALRRELKMRLGRASQGLPHGTEFSYGIAQGQASELSKLIKLADQAMYRKKTRSESMRNKAA